MVNSSAACSPHHQVATEGIFNGSPSSFLQMPGQEARQRRRLEQATAERVGDQNIAGTDGLQQAGNAERRIAAQFERIAVIVVEPAQDGVHPAQAAQRPQVDAFAAYRQIVPSTSGKPR
jgi:hypothetical protein